MADKVPAGSVPVGSEPTPEEEVNTAPETQPEPEKAPQPEPQGPSAEEKIAQLEKRLADREKTVGRQGSEMGELRKELEALKSASPQGPSEQEQMQAVLDQMEAGDLDLKTGLAKALEINSAVTSKAMMEQIAQQREQEKVSEVQQKFLKDNPDFMDLRESGALQPYLEADPMADEYTAYRQLKADERVKTLEAEYAQKIKEAEEKGAKLAQGSAEAGKVLGKTGSSARSAATAPKPFKNTREASDAMLAKLREIRGQAPG